MCLLSRVPKRYLDPCIGNDNELRLLRGDMFTHCHIQKAARIMTFAMFGFCTLLAWGLFTNAIWKGRRLVSRSLDRAR